MVGIETRPRPAASAREALDGDAEVVHADLRTLTLEPARAALYFERPSPSSSDEQEALLGALAARLDPAGVVADPRNQSRGRLAVHGGSRGRRRESSGVQDRKDSGVQSAHADGMARLLCTPRISHPARPMGDGTPSPTCCSASPGGRRVWMKRPTFTSCVSARPLRSKTPTCPHAADQFGGDAGPQ